MQSITAKGSMTAQPLVREISAFFDVCTHAAATACRQTTIREGGGARCNEHLQLTTSFTTPNSLGKDAERAITKRPTRTSPTYLGSAHQPQRHRQISRIKVHREKHALKHISIIEISDNALALRASDAKEPKNKKPSGDPHAQARNNRAPASTVAPFKNHPKHSLPPNLSRQTRDDQQLP
jgi:hypothetical protein